MTSDTKKNIVLGAALIALIVAWRLLTHFSTHAWNVAPVTAAALLAGMVMSRKWAVIVPVLGMLIADSIIGFYHVPVMLTVYACFALMVLPGAWLKKLKAHKLVLASLASSTFFFLATNFAVWATADWYPKTLGGLILAYDLAIPFFRNMMLGDLIFTGVLFGTWTLVNQIACSKSLSRVRGLKVSSFHG